MRTSPSLVWRAMLAVGLTAGFYLLALGIAGGLLYIPYAEWVYTHRLHGRLALSCLIGAGVILWSIVPRPDRFIPPGPRITPGEQPRLYAELRKVAEALGQPMPDEVYLTPEANAWVARRGGFMGFGSRRVMGLGLLYMQILTVLQFRAVVAHEFGHYVGGDVTLGPWIYRTREAIERTVGALAENNSILHKPFLWYGRLFLRITHAIARRQELAADVLAARVAGANAAISLWDPVRRAATAIEHYWREEVAPALQAGFRPPYAAGFAAYLDAPRMVENIAQSLAKETDETTPYDTHPPLRERIAAVQYLSPGPAVTHDPPAVTLLADLPGLEGRLFAAMGEWGRNLTPIGWEETAAQVYLPQWRELVREHAMALSGLTPEELPAVAKDLAGLGRRMRGDIPEERAKVHAIRVLGAALTLALLNRGATLHTGPGEPITLRLGGREDDPIRMVDRLAEGGITAEEWRRRCAEEGIEGIDLGKVAGGQI
ncbi:MAG: M48 family metallopeptidase [Bacteroidota bacterium]